MNALAYQVATESVCAPLAPKRPAPTQILDSKRPECSIRQVITGPITDKPGPDLVDTLDDRNLIPVASPGSTDDDWRFAYRLASAAADDTSANSDEENGESDDDIATNSAPGGARQQEGVVTSSSDTGSRQPMATGASDIAPAADTTTVGATPAKTEVDWSLDSENVRKAPGWESEAVTANNRIAKTSRSSSSSENRKVSPYTEAATQEKASLQQPVSASGERSYIEVMLDGGLSPAAAAAAGRDPAESARGVCASVVAKAVTVPFVGVTVVLGPVIGRVTQGSAVVLVEVGSKAPVACVLTDGVSGGQHRQVR